jgi:hypothetical protein
LPAKLQAQTSFSRTRESSLSIARSVNTKVIYEQKDQYFLARQALIYR